MTSECGSPDQVVGSFVGTYNVRKQKNTNLTWSYCINRNPSVDKKAHDFMGFFVSSLCVASAPWVAADYADISPQINYVLDGVARETQNSIK